MNALGAPQPFAEPATRTVMMAMTPPKTSETQKTISEFPVSPALAREIERALEMMQRVRTAQVAREQGAVLEPPGNKYELPEPPVLRVSGSTEGD